MAKANSFNTPLRYPGGKSRISNFIEDLILLNNLENSNLFELYAGGAGASLNVLFSGLCKKIILNDLDFHIYAFWYSILEHTEDFIRLIYDTKIDIANWDIQKNIYDRFESHSILEVGFSAFYLNRTNRSGILYKAGPIGGRSQNGNYLIDVRFNKKNLVDRIIKIANYKSFIEVHNKETIQYLKYIFKLKKKNLIFLDPPYYNQGENLYMNFYKDKDHVKLSKILQSNQDKNWLLTYDNVDRIKELYQNSKRAYFPMTYTLQKKKKDNEIMMISDNLHTPKQLRMGIKTDFLKLIK